MTIHQTTEDVVHIEKLLGLGYTRAQLSEEWGVAPGTIGEWLKRGSAPLWTLRAAEPLDADAAKTEILIIRIPSALVAQIKSVVIALGADIIKSIEI